MITHLVGVCLQLQLNLRQLALSPGALRGAHLQVLLSLLQERLTGRQVQPHLAQLRLLGDQGRLQHGHPLPLRLE